LKQVDLDGKSIYSRTVWVRFGISDELVLIPNPVTGPLHLSLPKGKRLSEISIFDASGREVWSKAFNMGSTELDLDLQFLPKGWYQVRLRGQDHMEASFIKQ
jgi:Secretion system C-terminal sorting domain